MNEIAKLKAKQKRKDKKIYDKFVKRSKKDSDAEKFHTATNSMGMYMQQHPEDPTGTKHEYYAFLKDFFIRNGLETKEKQESMSRHAASILLEQLQCLQSLSSQCK